MTMLDGGQNPRGGGGTTSTVFKNFSDHAAPPGHVTFSVLERDHSGHSVSVAANEYPGVVRTTKSVLSNLNRLTVFEGAIEIIRRSVVCTGDGCQCEDDGLFYAFISALLKHPDKRCREIMMADINAILKKEGGAHVILFMPPVGPSTWLVAAPAGNRAVQ